MNLKWANVLIGAGVVLLIAGIDQAMQAARSLAGELDIAFDQNAQLRARVSHLELAEAARRVKAAGAPAPGPGVEGVDRG